MIKLYDLRDIFRATSEAVGVSAEDARSRVRSLANNLCRGVYYLLSAESGHPPKQVAEYIGRKRSTAYLVGNTYKGYVTFKDKEVIRIYDRAKEILNTKYNIEHKRK